MPMDTLTPLYSKYMMMYSHAGLSFLMGGFVISALIINKGRNEELFEDINYVENLIKILPHDISIPLTLIIFAMFNRERRGGEITEKNSTLENLDLIILWSLRVM